MRGSCSVEVLFGVVNSPKFSVVSGSWYFGSSSFAFADASTCGIV